MAFHGVEPRGLTKVELDGGKYTVIHNHGFGLQALRYGEPWRDLVGDGLVLAMAHEIEQLRDQVKQLTDHKTALEISVNGLRRAFIQPKE